MLDFSRYFLPNAQIFLENINYELLKPTNGRVKMNCKDTIIARVMEPVGIKVTFNRALTFEPEGLFYLSVSFPLYFSSDVIQRTRSTGKALTLRENSARTAAYGFTIFPPALHFSQQRSPPHRDKLPSSQCRERQKSPFSMTKQTTKQKNDFPPQFYKNCGIFIGLILY